MRTSIFGIFAFWAGMKRDWPYIVKSFSSRTLIDSQDLEALYLENDLIQN